VAAVPARHEIHGLDSCRDSVLLALGGGGGGQGLTHALTQGKKGATKQKDHR